MTYILLDKLVDNKINLIYVTFVLFEHIIVWFFIFRIHNLTSFFLNKFNNHCVSKLPNV